METEDVAIENITGQRIAVEGGVERLVVDENVEARW